MSDNFPGALPPELEDLIAFRVAKRALRTIAAMLAPMVLILAWLGYNTYNRFEEAYQARLKHLLQASGQTEARAMALMALTDSLQRLVHSQTDELAHTSREIDKSLGRNEAMYLRLVQQAADDRVQLLSSVSSAVGRANQMSTKMEQSMSGIDSALNFASRTGPEIVKLRSAYDSARQGVQQALDRIEESGVQTVGARQRRHLYGTPFDVYFSGISGDNLRDFMISFQDGRTIKSVPRHPSSEIVEIEAGGTRYLIAIVNTIDIPGGVFRLNGSSRADAATFRVSRSPSGSAGTLSGADRPLRD
jgi:uncharacterized protein YcbK (DUF882 family)